MRNEIKKTFLTKKATISNKFNYNHKDKRTKSCPVHNFIKPVSIKTKIEILYPF